MRLQVHNLSFQYNEQSKIEHISLQVNEGEFVGIIGPNGSGKSTLLKSLYKSLKPDDGSIYLDGENYLKQKPKATAKKVGVVGQEQSIPFDFKVEEIVAMGRSPYKGLFDPDNNEDREIVTEALRAVGLAQHAKQSYLNLSGGEKQRVVIARVLAQKANFLILDEPTNHLDIQYQLQMFDLLKGLRLTVLSAIHDLNFAALYCDRIYVMKDGKIYGSGTPEELLTSKHIQAVFGVKAYVEIHPITQKINITYLPASL